MRPRGAAGYHGQHMLDLAIVGGGPGGLMSAWYLKKKLGELCRVTIYEASDRLGGKILTRKFDSAPAMDDSDGCRAGPARRRALERRARHASQIRRQDRGCDRVVPQTLHRDGVPDRI